MADLIEKNIIKNLFTKCSQCKIKAFCAKHRDVTLKIQKEIKDFSQKTNARQREKPGSIEWSRELDNIITDFKRSKVEEFDKYLGDTECSYEKEELIDDLQMLQSRYDFTDPRVYLTVKQYLKQAVLDFRAFKTAANQDLVDTRYDQDGQAIKTLNPLLNYKMSSSNTMTKLIDNLDRYSKEDRLLDSMEIAQPKLFDNFLVKLNDSDKVITINDELND